MDFKNMSNEEIEAVIEEAIDKAVEEVFNNLADNFEVYKISKTPEQDGNHLRDHLIEPNIGLNFILDSCWTDEGWETVAFLCDFNGEITDYNVFYCEHYKSLNEMRDNHLNIVNNPNKIFIEELE